MPTSIISLDLGGKNTGFFSFTTKNLENIENYQSGTIVYDESFVLSQEKRRAKRHIKRNILRKKLAKRLFLLILQKHFNIQISYLPDEISGLFNKRGFTYAGLELEEKDLELLENDNLREILEEQFGTISQENLLDFLEFNLSSEESLKTFKKNFIKIEENKKKKLKSKLLENLTFDNEPITNYFVATLYNNGLANLSKKISAALKDKSIEDKNTTLQNYIQNLIDSDDNSVLEKLKKLDKETKEIPFNKEILSGLNLINKQIENIEKEIKNGNLPRAKYFKELEEWVNNHKDINNFLASNKIEKNSFINIVGNISNFQLKELRRYFNDKNMQSGDIWDSEKLKKVVHRFIASWHAKGDESLKKLQSKLLKDLKEKDIIEFLTNTNPLETIPPYDDMNNRGAVKCQTLRLNKNYLDTHLPNWRVIANRLADEFYKTDLEECTANDSDTDLTLLHRVLDTSSQIDPYNLRDDKIDGYVDILGKENAEKLKSFCKKYYELIKDKVRTGIWQESDYMLEKCEKNPPYKNNQIHNLVAGILGINIKKERFEEFEKTIWKEKFKNKNLLNYCKNIEELRKSKGNMFKYYALDLKEKQNISGDEKKDLTLLDDETLYFWTDKIAEFFSISKEQKSRFQNHFSMAQLYTIIETRRSGFNSTCKWCSSENSFRSVTNLSSFTIFDKSTGEKIVDTAFDETKHIKVYENANAQRLPADTQRPFSGKIERYIDKLGYEIAKIKAKELEKVTEKNIKIKIILEENSFEYEESIRSAKIKNAKKKANVSLENSKKSYEKSLEDKASRIKNFGNNICAYCSKEIVNNDGEIDHILPRSYTLKNYGTVFNSEGNLLYVHQKCNQDKKDKIYSLDKITAPISKEQIISGVESIKSYKTFTLLSNEQQIAFKYALFLPHNDEAFKKVAGFLRTDQSARVNGTQKYLAKKIQTKLNKMFENKKELDYEFILADSEVVSSLRKQYAKEEPLLAKPKDSKQASSSHTIDAILSLVSVYKKATNLDVEPNASEIVKYANIKSWSALENEFLTKGKSTNQKIENMIETESFTQKNMREVFNKSIFGENALGERFKPIVISNDTIYIGFPIKIKDGYSFENCKQITSKNDKHMVENIIKSELVSKKDKSTIVIYEINKNLFNELSNEYFNLNYKNLADNKKEQVATLEFIIKFSKFYTKRANVISAPSYKKQIEEMKYPFYNEWKLFDEAWKHLMINKNKKGTKDRYVIDKKQENSHYKIDLNKGEYKLDTDNRSLWDDFCKWYFLDRYAKSESNSIRRKARKNFSLIAEGTPQGTMFRLKRKTPKGFVYQALPIDNKQIAGDYSNILLHNNKGSISLLSSNTKKDLTKEFEIKVSKDIRDTKLHPAKFFKDDFNYGKIEVILNKTSATIKNFPLDYFINSFIQKNEEFETNLNSLSFVKNSEEFGVIKSKLDQILKMTTRGDQKINQITINDNFIDFILPYKNTSKLLDE